MQMIARIACSVVLAATLVSSVTACSHAQSAGEAPPTLRGKGASGALGFHNTAAPLGFRWWLGGQKFGLDAAVGYTATPATLADDKTLATWTIDGGLPMTLRNWDRVRLLLRPGLIFQREQVERPAPTFETDDVTTVDVTVEFEAEVFLADRFSVSAAHGASYQTIDRPGGGSVSTFGTTGGNFTSVGFHVYFLLDGK
jgi:hypothetical protein